MEVIIIAYYRKKPCAHPGCKNYATDGSYCSDHQEAHAPSRNTTSKFVPFYKTTWWKKHREAFLVSHIYCEECKRKGMYTLAQTVHHTRGFCDWSTFCDVSKWEAWCSSCHSKLHTTITNEQLYEKNK